MIPPVIHFVWISVGEPLAPLHRFCIASAVKNTSCRVVLHTNDPSLQFAGVETRLREFPTSINGIPFDPSRRLNIGDGIGTARAVAHLSDIVRLEILLEEGGIYSDCDVLWLRNPYELLTQKVAIGFANKSYKVLQNSTLFAQKGEEAIRLYRDWLVSIFPCSRYATPANPWKLWKDRADVTFVEQRLLNPVRFSKVGDITWKMVAGSICVHLSNSKEQEVGGEVVECLKDWLCT